MVQTPRGTVVLALAAAAALATVGARLSAQQGAAATPTNNLPNPYNTVNPQDRGNCAGAYAGRPNQQCVGSQSFFKLPAGRNWGSTSAVEVDKDGRSIWVAERCGANSCLDRATGQMSQVPVVLKFDANGNLLTSFGRGLIIFPHGIHVDADGNVWVTDGQDNAPAPARGGGPGAGAAAGGARAGGAAPAAGGGAPQGGRGPAPAPRANPASTKGHQVFKFSPTGQVLMTLGKPGGGNDPEYFFQPNDVITNAAGEIFVSEGHSSAPGSTGRILKFDKTGKLIKVIGRFGSGPGEFNQPHALAFDSQGRLFVGDRGNNRVQIISQDGAFIADWPQFSRPSGIFIDKNDTLYVADSESGSVNPAHGAWKRGIRIGSARTGEVTGFIPDPEGEGPNPTNTGTLAAEGVTADAAGTIYGAEVGPRAVRKYTKK